MNDSVVLPKNQYFKGDSFEEAAKSLGLIMEELEKAFSLIADPKILNELVTQEIQDAIAKVTNRGEGAISKDLEEIRNEYRSLVNVPKEFEINGQKKIVNPQTQKLFKNIAFLKNMLKKYESGGKDFKVGAESDLIKSFIWSTVTLLRTMLGFISEETLAKEVQNVVNKDLEKHFQGKGVSFVAQKVGSERNTSKNVKTADVSASIVLTDLKGGQISIDLPDISLKRTSADLSKDTATIKIKTKAKLDRFFNDGSFGRRNNDIIHFLAANTSDASDELHRKNHTKYFFDYLKIAMFPTALAGNLTPGDFAYFFVVNNRVYSVLDIITGAKNGENFAKNLQWPGYTNIIKDLQNEKKNSFKDMITLASNVEVNLVMLSKLLNEAKHLTK